MKKKLWILSIGAAVILVLTFFPTIVSQPLGIEEENSVMETPEEMIGNSGSMTMNVYHFKEDGTYEKTVKELTLAEREALMDEMTEAEKSGLTLIEIFEEKLQILKNYELVSEDIALEDIVDVDKLIEPVDIVSGENFEAEFAPIFLGGIGFGFGFGIPSFVTSGTFLLVMAGAGLVLCLDVLNATLYMLQTFLLPVLIGFLGGFTGLLLFGIVPGVFYSNFIGLGMVAKTVWIQFPTAEEGFDLSELGEGTINMEDLPLEMFGEDYQVLIPLVNQQTGLSNID